MLGKWLKTYRAFFLLYDCFTSTEASEYLLKNFIVLNVCRKLVIVGVEKPCSGRMHLCIHSLSTHKCARLYTGFHVEKYAFAIKWPSWGDWLLNKQFQYNIVLRCMRKNKGKTLRIRWHVFTEMTFSFGH